MGLCDQWWGSGALSSSHRIIKSLNGWRATTTYASFRLANHTPFDLLAVVHRLMFATGIASVVSSFIVFPQLVLPLLGRQITLSAWISRSLGR